MNNEQKEIAEKIISMMKLKKNGFTTIKDISSLEINPLLRNNILDYLKNHYHLITKQGDYYKLTPKGYDFDSFKKLQKEIEDDLEYKNLEIKLAKSNIEANKINKRNNIVNYIAFALNIIFTLINFYIITRE